MKKTNLIILLITLGFLTLGMVSLINFYYYTLEIRTIDIDFKVGDRIGINLDTDKLWFGTVKPGASATRSIIISNDFDFPISIKFLVKGELEDNIAFSENNVIINSKKNKEIRVTANAPRGMSFGNYSSTMKVVLRRA
ncbi:MAG: hypothetical protein KKA65_01105 [Nanoarchaeota archaeon]|nr:hypothetical protein [Nanoarchaeota archaeon]MBU4352219.1 hypothetical protein [Nanoarchaeota archaeon]MBU4456077.1 hypothetical protein [Nanoarchaeota archaeon]MCG2719236.1 hypothetical protein [Nanoarchaeota archaeon]